MRNTINDYLIAVLCVVSFFIAYYVARLVPESHPIWEIFVFLMTPIVLINIVLKVGGMRK